MGVWLAESVGQDVLVVARHLREHVGELVVERHVHGFSVFLCLLHRENETVLCFAQVRPFAQTNVASTKAAMASHQKCETLALVCELWALVVALEELPLYLARPGEMLFALVMFVAALGGVSAILVDLCRVEPLANSAHGRGHAPPMLFERSVTMPTNREMPLDRREPVSIRH